jgi:hypothetical protein
VDDMQADGDTEVSALHREWHIFMHLQKVNVCRGIPVHMSYVKNFWTDFSDILCYISILKIVTQN